MDIQLIVFAYNRPFHTEALLKAIRKEGFGRFKVYVDGPRTEDDVRQQRLLRRLFERIDWAECEVEYRNKCHGLARSISAGVEDALTHHDAVIVLEDDCLPRTGFRRYMRTALNVLQGAGRVRSVCGYTYPCFTPDLLAEDVFFLDRFCPWGWGTWKDRWTDFTLDLSQQVRRARICGLELESVGRDIAGYCSEDLFLEMKSDIWSLNWILCHILTGSLVLYPKHSLIENIGFDGSGVHSTKTDVFATAPLPGNDSINLSMLADKPPVLVNAEIRDRIIRFLEKNSKMSMVLNSQRRTATDPTRADTLPRLANRASFKRKDKQAARISATE